MSDFTQSISYVVYTVYNIANMVRSIIYAPYYMVHIIWTIYQRCATNLCYTTSTSSKLLINEIQGYFEHVFMSAFD